jgi:hypothetical protein
VPRQQIAAILDERTPGIEERERAQNRSRQVRILKSALSRGRMREGGERKRGSECRRGGKEEKINMGAHHSTLVRRSISPRASAIDLLILPLASLGYYALRPLCLIPAPPFRAMVSNCKLFQSICEVPGINPADWQSTFGSN